ncbi:hypothetical protein [Nodularia sphaerocarpa]|uniref:hypothetical protein n=1 Tax=Nodularia sphaerocarpa TaxID=137816 RepID=UPI001EFA34F5|nr:hypothetical protein [Nodularia sphaerocarpa]MDB9374679.1 hypothetical protein [Nodularia sphaerocarpa CS-585]MDB9380088.1 hypothetical protein [Nodularia sphaerocarpa CS-585A2]ULP73088.1 hypothetical protein BDGGKGIB_02741 [Nodularia sphaerocarpa UHCC 0038]
MRKQILYILFLLSLFSVLGFSEISTYISEKRPIVSCQQWGFNRTQGEKYYAHPDKLVVEPWRGQHNVYAIFVIPTGYKSDGLFTVSIPGSQTYCGRFQNIGKVLSGVDQPRSYTKIRGFLNTRIAVKLIAQGKLSELKEPDNWRLGYFKRYQRS